MVCSFFDVYDVVDVYFFCFGNFEGGNVGVGFVF